MAKLEVTLKQHTPLIHFESDVEGATLRATELKSKLDKFLIEHFQKESIDYSNYLIKGQNKSFNYKVKIKNDNENNKKKLEIGKSFPLFFGNMGQLKRKDFSFFDRIKVEFFSFNEDIIAYIKSILPEFLFLNNFGTRQSKGFGSFFIHNSEINFNFNEVEKIKKENYNFQIEKEGIDKVFNSLEVFYKSLRSGINRNNRFGETIFYCKPAIFHYNKKLGFEWDKKNIKKEFLDINSLGETLIKENLGFSSEEMWRSYYDKKNSNNNIVKTLKISKSIKNVDRYKSPILFKILEEENFYDVYLITDNNKKLINKEIEIKFDSNIISKIDKGKNKPKAEIYLGNKKNIGIEIPKNKIKLKISNFDLNDFLDFSFNKKRFNFLETIDITYRKSSEYQILNNIYKKLEIQVINND